MELNNIDVELLKEQRDLILKTWESGVNDLADGLVNLLDDIIDKLEDEKC